MLTSFIDNVVMGKRTAVVVIMSQVCQLIVCFIMFVL